MSAEPVPRRIAVTGGFGFLGWHLSARIHTLHSQDAVRLGRAEFSSASALAGAIGDCDTIVHLAGINRAASDEEVETGNVELARTLAEAIKELGRPVHVVYGNSIQAHNDSPYGRGKAKVAMILASAVAEVGGTLANVLLPNLFGEHGVPNYNSFVATFCHALATGGKPEVGVDNEVPLLHAQRAAAALLKAAQRRTDETVEPDGVRRRVTAVLAQLELFHDTYAAGEVPPLLTDFDVDLFNTYRSYVFPDLFPIRPKLHADPRGELSEVVRAHGGTGMAFVSTTRPGKSRGDHYHLHKIERFFVALGEAEISLRRLLHDQVVTFRLSGDAPGFVDMPTLWVHNIRNVGQSDLVTVFWADQLLDQENPDQYAQRVNLEDVNQ